jgi:DNA replication protein DnaC
MLKQPLLDQLQALKLSGMRQALHEQLHMPDSDQLSFTDRLSLLVDRELTERANRRLQYRLQQARLPQQACREDLDYHHPWGLDKTLIQHLLGERWLVEHLNCLITGPTGAGKPQPTDYPSR